MNKLRLIILLLFSYYNALACPTITVSSTDVNCYLGTNGSASATISGPDSPFSYSWSNGQSGSVSSGGSTSISNLPAGVYTIYVVDQLGCTSTHVISVEEPSPLTGVISTTTDVNCNGGADGTIDLTPVGGTPSYSFSWSNGSGSEDPSGLSAGTHSVTITDGNGCTSNSISAVIGEPVMPLTSTIQGVDAMCFGGTDGAVDLSPSGGTSPYTYSWSNGAISEDLTNVPAGSYSVTITDNNGCTTTNNATVSEPTQIQSTISSVDVLCFGGSDGDIDLSVSGGTPGYAYHWANSSSILVGTTEDLVNYPSSTYFVTVTDANGCTHTNNATINEPPLLTTFLIPTHIKCFGDNTGAIQNMVNGGTLPYSYNWSSGASSQHLVSQFAGTYSVTITDAHGCTVSDQTTLTEPDAPLVTTYDVTNVTCFGFLNGLIDYNVTGGTIPYNFDWNNGQYITEDLDYIPAGVYTVQVTDENNCTISNTITVTEPAALVSNTVATNVLCFADTNGMIDLTVTGGTLPYEYQWGNTSSVLIDTNQDMVNYPANTYYVKIIDSLGCILFDEDSITQPDELLSELIPTHVLCYGDFTGEIATTITGGVTPYVFDWNNNAYTTEDLQNLPYGGYGLTLTDANACVLNDTTYLEQPMEPLYAFYDIIIPSCFSYSDGQVSYTVEGGTAPYNYLWNRGDTVLTLFDVAAGELICVTTDAHNCILKDTVNVGEPDQLMIDSVVTDVTCFELLDGEIDVTVTGGTMGYDYSWTNSDYELSVNTEDLIGYPADTYIVQVIDSNACEAYRTIVISEPPLLEGYTNVDDVTCYGDNDGSVDAIITGGNIGGYTYNWNNGASTSLIENLSPGLYETDVVDTKGCVVYVRGFVHEPDPIVIEHLVYPLSCRDIADASIETNPIGGNGGFTFSWDYENETDADIYNLHSGNYTVTVVDILNCTKDSIIVVPVNEKLCLTPPTAFTPDGDGYNDIWFLENIELYPTCEVIVYNKWGRKLFESTGYTAPWDGNFKGQPLPPDTYYYSIKIIDDAVYTGVVTIVR